MSFVYAPYRGREAASSAVEALIDQHIPLRSIEVIAERAGRQQRISIVHSRPIGRGAVIGAALGLFAGALLGSILGHEAVAAAVASKVAFGLVAGVIGGTFVGALAGLVTWRNRPAFPGSVGEESDVLVGASVGRGRIREVQSALAHAGANRTFVATRA